MPTPDNIRAALRIDRCASVSYCDPSAPERTLELEIYQPPSHAPHGHVVLSLPSSTRDGAAHREIWMPAANRHGLLVVAINFPKSTWPGRLTYNEGNVCEPDGTVRPRSGWAFGIPARVLDLLRQAGITTREKAILWGHSAGGQFAHRMLACAPADALEKVVAANAGLYAMPSFETPYPYGLGGIGLTHADLVRYLAFPLEVVAGERDTGPDRAETLDAAQTQGENRFIRAENFVARGHAKAARLGVPCGWRFIAAANIGHKGKFMAKFSAKQWFGR